jgi:hypothetical protein
MYKCLAMMLLKAMASYCQCRDENATAAPLWCHGGHGVMTVMHGGESWNAVINKYFNLVSITGIA